MMVQEDVVQDPSHYSRWAIEPATFIMRNGFEFWRGNLIKYSSRAGYKQYDGKTMKESEITDLEKVKRYCDMRIEELSEETKSIATVTLWGRVRALAFGAKT